MRDVRECDMWGVVVRVDYQLNSRSNNTNKRRSHLALGGIAAIGTQLARCILTRVFDFLLLPTQKKSIPFEGTEVSV